MACGQDETCDEQKDNGFENGREYRLGVGYANSTQRQAPRIAVTGAVGPPSPTSTARRRIAARDGPRF